MNEPKITIEELEEAEDIRLYDEGMLDNEPSVAIEEAFKMIEGNRIKINEVD